MRIKLALVDHFGRFDLAVRPSHVVRGALSGPATAENRHSAEVIAVPARWAELHVELLRGHRRGDCGQVSGRGLFGVQRCDVGGECPLATLRLGRNEELPPRMPLISDEAEATAYSSNAVLPTPASPFSTRTPLRPTHAPSSSPSRTAHSSRRPRSIGSRGADEPRAMRTANPKARDEPNGLSQLACGAAVRQRPLELMWTDLRAAALPVAERSSRAGAVAG